MTMSENGKHKGLKCGARKRSNPYERCTQAAGWGTDHPGVGRCKLHGGASPIKHGRYSSIVRPDLRAIIDQLEEEDKKTANIEEDIRLCRAMLIREMQKADGEGDDAPFDFKFAIETLERLSRMSKRHHEMQDQKSVSLETLVYIKSQMGLVVAEHVKDADTLRSIESGWSAIVIRKS